MFTGIVQAVGQVSELSGSHIAILAGKCFDREDLQIGESIAINGTCLTLVPGTGGETLHFEVSPETFLRTALGDLKAGDPVNLERAMSVLGRFGGHIVQGHVDATGTLLSRRPEGGFEVLRFQAPAEYDRLLIDKGSIAVDGVSLTVVDPEDGAFDVWAIPHTLESTNLGSLSSGSRVNFEFDVLAKYVEKLVASRLAGGGAGSQELGAPRNDRSLPQT